MFDLFLLHIVSVNLTSEPFFKINPSKNMEIRSGHEKQVQIQSTFKSDNGSKVD